MAVNKNLFSKIKQFPLEKTDNVLKKKSPVQYRALFQSKSAS